MAAIKKSMFFGFEPVSTETTLTESIEIVLYDSVEEAFSVTWGGDICPEDEFCFELSTGEEGSKSMKDFCDDIKEIGVWGFVSSRDNVIHLWVDHETAEFETVLSFFAHEIGHLQTPAKKDLMKEEMKAERYSDVTRAAYQLSKTVLEGEEQWEKHT